MADNDVLEASTKMYINNARQESLCEALFDVAKMGESSSSQAGQGWSGRGRGQTS